MRRRHEVGREGLDAGCVWGVVLCGEGEGFRFQLSQHSVKGGGGSGAS